jgi:pimeloyl-ACP methyl ester carboxylesterase
MIVYRILSVLLVLLLLPTCGQKQNGTIKLSPDDFFNWFISPWTHSIRSVASGLPDSASLIQALQAIRRTAITDTYTIRLSDSTGTPYTTGIKAPSSIRQDTAYPLIIYLHGGTGTELDTKGEVAWDMLSPLADTFTLFLASPSANRYAFWWSPEGLSRVLQTLRFMTLHYPVDRTKVFLAGVSDGAMGCYAAANSIAGPFAGFIAVSGYAGMLPQMGIELSPQNLMQRPIYNINAGQDRLYPIEIVNRFLDWLGNQGVNITRKVYPDELHGFDYKAKEMGTLADLIRTWSRPSTNVICWAFTRSVHNCAVNIIDYKLTEDNIKPEISGRFLKDTLVVQSSGMRSVLIENNGIEGPLFVRSADGSVAKVQPYRENDLSLKRMLYTQFPDLTDGNAYLIKLKE